MYCIEVHSGKSLAELLKAFPKAEVRTLISEPNQDCWRVSFDVEDVNDSDRLRKTLSRAADFKYCQRVVDHQQRASELEQLYLKSSG